MRILGWLLLVGGLLLCVSIVWAAPGFFCMGLGLIFLQIAERKRRRAKSAASPPDQSEPQLEPVAIPEAARALVPPNADADARAGRENATGLRSYDTQKWRALLSSDGDIWRLANALEPYGQQYVDEFAAAYLAVNDKDHLPMILRQIIASARRDSAQNLASDFPDKNTNADAVAVANRTRRIDRVREMQSAYAEKSASVDNTPEVDAGPERERVSQPSGRDFSGDVDASAACKTAAEEANPKPVVAGAERNVSTVGEIAVEATSPEPPEVPDAAVGPDEKKPTREVDAVDADNLTEILNQLNQAPTPKAE
jgi:hypothetical protein